MNFKVRLVATIAVAIFATSAYSQDYDFGDVDLTLPNSAELDVLEAELSDADVIAKLQQIKASGSVKEILPIEGVLTVDEPLMFLETLKFEDGGTLQLTAGNHDRIFLLAKEVRLNGPNLRANIKYADRDPINGQDAEDHTGRAADHGGGRSGSPKSGANGLPGLSGESGLSRRLPTLWIVADELQARKTTDAPFATPDVRMYLDGINGGEGGKGGKGQQGGKGQPGRNGDPGTFDCQEGPRYGGYGGRGGAFGPGGVGGPAGNGGDIVFVVSSEFAEEVKDMRLLARPGLPGQGGLNGEPGEGGPQGNNGKTKGSCDDIGGSKRGPGAEGKAAKPFSRAESGSDEAKRGRFRFVIYPDVASLFD